MNKLKQCAIFAVLVVGVSAFLAAVITSDHNPINKVWYSYVCGNLMTVEETDKEGRCR